jgi:hypothetical protein
VHLIVTYSTQELQFVMNTAEQLQDTRAHAIKDACIVVFPHEPCHQHDQTTSQPEFE